MLPAVRGASCNLPGNTPKKILRHKVRILVCNAVVFGDDLFDGYRKRSGFVVKRNAGSFHRAEVLAGRHKIRSAQIWKPAASADGVQAVAHGAAAVRREAGSGWHGGVRAKSGGQSRAALKFLQAVGCISRVLLP